MNRRRLALIARILAVAATWLLFAATLFCRFASCISPERGEFWALAALQLPVVLLLDAVVLAGWLLRRRWRLAALPLAAWVLSAGYVSALVQPPALRPAKERPRDLRIMTLNAYGFLYFGGPSLSAPPIASLCEREQIDILCLQETFGAPGFPGDSIASRFAGYFPCFIHEELIAIGSRYPIIDHRYVLFPGTLNDYMWADLAIGTDTVRLFTVHLQTTGISELQRRFRQETGRPAPLREIMRTLGHNSRLRAQQVEEIRQVIDTTRYPVILTGDFNDLPGSYTYRRLKGSMTDSFRSAGHGYGSTYRRLGGWLRIDYIFHDENFATVHHSILPDEVSDHSAVIADLRFVH